MPQYTAESLPAALKRQAELTTLLEERLKDAFGKNATFAKSPAVDRFLKMDMVRSVIWSLASGQRILFKGDSGIGKTSFVKWVLNLLDVDLVYLPAASISVENLMVPTPVTDEATGRKVLDFSFYENLTAPGDKVILIDEIGRADRSLGNTIMEILQEGSLAGRPIPGLVSVMAADNLANGEYGKINALDLAQATRFVTVEVDTTSTPWMYALAARFADVDLTDLFAAYAKFDGKQRVRLSPAVLENVVTAVLAGLPAVTGLPKVAGERLKVENAAGRDTTDETLEAICRALGQPVREVTSDTVRRAIEHTLADGMARMRADDGFATLYLEGAPGVGKTAHIKAEVDRLGVEMVYLSAPAMSPEDLTIPFPGTGGDLELMPMRWLMTPEPKVVVIDEVYRAARRTANAFMELTSEGSVGGQKVPGLVAVIGLNNPKEVAGFKLDVGKADMAQARRFHLSADVTASDVPAMAFLLSHYGEELAAPFIEWWQDDIGDIERALVPPRSLEAMIGLHAAGLPVEWGKGYVGDEYVAVPLVDLLARLDNQPQARLRAIAANVDDYEAKLAEGEKNPEVQTAVFLAFSKAELSQLEANREVVVRLLAVLEKQHRINLIKNPGPKQRFWQDALMAMRKDLAA